jgi:hypothetical protein
MISKELMARAAAGLALMAVLCSLPSFAQAESSGDADTGRLERLEAEVAALRADLAARLEPSSGELAELAELERRIEALAAEIEKLRLGEATSEADRSEYGLGPAASKVYRVGQGLSVGGYGELLYQNFADRRDNGSPAGRTDEFDLLRGVFYFGYKFDQRWIFNSEIEYEHAQAGEGKKGEVSVEFAALEYHWRPALNARAGLLLVPLGLVNELHEPTVYLGTRRPLTETAIIPSTWRENGAGIFGDAGPISYRAYVLNGFDAGGFSAAGLRGGRQSGAQAKAEDFAVALRADWTAVPGLLVGGGLYDGGAAQNLATDSAVRIVEAHADWRWRGLWLRALAARADLTAVAKLNRLRGLTGEASIGERLEGQYVEIAYDLVGALPRGRGAMHAQVMPFLRWETIDTQARVPAGFRRAAANDRDSLTVGLAYLPIDRVVLKLDYQDFDDRAGAGVDQFNLSLGYVF